jgi:hypothetical protein
MASALFPLRKVQIGFESTPGTLVAATQQLVGVGELEEEIGREFEEFPRGVRAPVTGGGYDIQHGSVIRLSDMNLTYEEAIYPLLMGLVNDAVPGGAGPYTWDGTPVLTAAAAIKTATVEFVIDDGAAQHVERESGYAFCTGFEVSLAANQIAKLSMDLAARRSQASTFTTGLTPVTGRTPIPANLFKIWIDDAWANLGTTQKTTLIRAATLRVDTGLTPDFTLDGLADLDLTQISSGMLDAELTLTAEVNADAATEIGNFRGSSGAGVVRFVRLAVDNGAAAGANKQVQFDGAFKHTSAPVYSQDNGIELVTMTLGLEYDATGTNALVMTVINGLATQP